MLIKYNAALCSKSKRRSRPVNELTKSKLMVLCNTPPNQLFCNKHPSTQRVTQAADYHAVVSVT